MAFMAVTSDNSAQEIETSVRARLERLGQRELATEGLRSRAVKICKKKFPRCRRLARSEAKRE
jgi:hypothetical protein